MNGLEKRFYEEFLIPMQVRGDIHDLGYEAEEFEIAHRCKYIPDFLCRSEEGKRLAYEVKAPHRFAQKGELKTKFFASKYPNIEVYLVKWKNKRWVIKRIPALLEVHTPELPEDDE